MTSRTGWKPVLPETTALGADHPKPRGLFTTLARHPFRVGRRTLWLVAELGIAAIDYLFRVALRPGASPFHSRGLWLQRACRRALRVFNVELRSAGPVPARGMLVSNHLGYLDILVIGATAPAAFVAKREVRCWPVFGWFARRAGTIFVNRERRRDVNRSLEGIQTALDAGALVVLFPEGTSFGGDRVLPFRSALLEPATQSRHPLAACSLRFHLEDGSVPNEVCYWRDMTLVPHLLNLLGKRRVSASVSFVSIQEHTADRKELARQLHAEVTRLKSSTELASTPFR